MSPTTPCEACGQVFCPYECEDEPCYGEIRSVEVKEYQGNGYVGETHSHACEGHRFGGMYVEEP